MTFRHDAAGTPAHAWRRLVADLDLPPLSWDGVRRVLVVAAHPDDETLGAGGLVARAHDLGLVVDVVVATRGEGSHPASPTLGADELGVRREAELREAVDLLSPGSTVDVLGLPDGGLGDHEDELLGVLVDRLVDGRDAVVVAPWRGDGHPDHEATGRAAATAAARTGATLLEYPVWTWHWAAPGTDDLPWPDALRLDLSDGERTRKQHAIAAHRTQVAPLSPAAGDEVLLGPGLLEHFAAPYEVFWRQAVVDDALDALHRDHDDPWGVEHRWYEERRRDLLLAMLPRRRFRRGIEVGCSTGALTAALAARVDDLLAVDSSAAAVGAARARLAGEPGVDVRAEQVPRWWTDGPLDLVVLSEVGYFLSPADLDTLAGRVADSLTDDGVVVLAHWRHPVDGWPMDGPDVHARLTSYLTSCRAAGLPPVVASYVDRDVEILVLADLAQLPDPQEEPG